MFNDNVPFIGRDDAGDRTAAAPANDLTLSGRAKICVIGVGGAGNNAVNRMIEAGITSAERRFRSAVSGPRASARAQSPKSVGKPPKRARKSLRAPSRGRTFCSSPQVWEAVRVRVPLP